MPTATCTVYVASYSLKIRLHACTKDQPIMLIFYLLCYALVLKFLTYYALYYAHVKDLCLKFDSVLFRVYSLVSYVTGFAKSVPNGTKIEITCHL